MTAAGSRRRLTPQRGQKLTVNKPAETTEVPMQPQTMPTVVMTDDGLRAIWQSHKEALTDADEAASKAVALEQSFANRRQTAREVREQIEKLAARAADLEADANAEEKTAQGLRGDERHFRATAEALAATVHFLGQANNLVHPAEREKRDAELAAQKAAAQALTVQVGPGMDHLVSSSSFQDATRPFPNSGEQM